jgi:outer membrane protein OmpA-like peptidoglycan-associated protein
MNTSGRELFYYMIPGSEEAFFCSTQNSDGYGDIKRYKLMPEDVITPAGPVVDEVVQVPPPTKEEIKPEMLAVSGQLLDNITNQHIGNGKITFLHNGVEIASINSDPQNGSYLLEMEPEDNFLIRINAKGYLSYEESYIVPEFEEGRIKKDFKLEPIEIGKTYNLDNVLFFRGTADLIDSSYVELDMVLRMLEENPDIDIELHGHTDNQGSARKNVVLSQQRVDVVRQYLIDHGIDEGRISGRGFGGARPIASNANEKSRQLNRRVEFIIKEKR